MGFFKLICYLLLGTHKILKSFIYCNLQFKVAVKISKLLFLENLKLYCLVSLISVLFFNLDCFNLFPWCRDQIGITLWQREKLGVLCVKYKPCVCVCQESMKMMGLSNWLHWTAWFVKYFLFLMISVTIMTVFYSIKVGPKLENVIGKTDPTVVFVFLILYAISSIMFCFFISVFFSTGECRCFQMWDGEGRKEMFYLMTHSSHFIYSHMVSDI